ncbi:hypothetical protein NPIL_461361 [Nephila pilipes]|uniref:Uncharacterized protein n=1 Tax=Nephila pilipes TaxID=299642 RepID=A0A8X6R0L6_NEPPI|nr:hypothetical protein NPIL_461361 [Nephila pilipes]
MTDTKHHGLKDGKQNLCSRTQQIYGPDYLWRLTDPSGEEKPDRNTRVARLHFLNTVHLVDDCFEADLPLAGRSSTTLF